MRLELALALLICGCATQSHFIISQDGSPSAPAPTDPDDGFVTVDEKPQWGWRLAPGTDGAQVEVCEDRKCNQRLFVAQAKGTRVTSPEAMQTGVYWWRLRGSQGNRLGKAHTPIRRLALELRASLKSELINLEVPREDIATGKRLGALADRALRHYAEVFGQPLPDKRLNDAFYGTEDGYHIAALAAAGGEARNPGGFSNRHGAHIRWTGPLPRSAQEVPGDVEVALLHELAHQFQIDRVEGYRRQPGWLKEGLADVLAERTLAKFYGVDAIGLPAFNRRISECRDLVTQKRWIPLGTFLDLDTKDTWSSSDADVQLAYYSQSYCIAHFLETDPTLAKPFGEFVRFASTMFDAAVSLRLRRRFAALLGEPGVIDTRIVNWLNSVPLLPWQIRGNGEYRLRPDGGLVFDVGARAASLVHQQTIAGQKRVVIVYDAGNAGAAGAVFGHTGSEHYRVSFGEKIDVLRCNEGNCWSVAHVAAEPATLNAPQHRITIDLQSEGYAVDVDGAAKVTGTWARVPIGRVGLHVINGWALLRSVDISDLPAGDVVP